MKCILGFVLVSFLNTAFAAAPVKEKPQTREKTTFQTSNPWKPVTELFIGHLFAQFKNKPFLYVPGRKQWQIIKTMQFFFQDKRRH